MRSRVSQVVALLLLSAGWTEASGTEVPETERTVSFSVSEGTGYSIAVSPDAQAIAMDLQGQLWVVPSTGGPARRITGDLDEWRLPHWSPSGDLIAAQRFVRDNFQIVVIDPDDRSKRQLTFGGFDSREPFWTPDGDILFSTERNGSYDILSIDPESRQAEVVVQGPADEFFPAISPDGTKLAYIQLDESGSYIVVRDGEQEHRRAAQNARFPGWNAAGDTVCFHTAQRDNFYGGWTRVDCWMPVSDELWTLTDEKEDVFPSRPAWLGDETVMYPAGGKIRKRHVTAEQIDEVPFTAEFTVATRPVYPKKDHQFSSIESRPVLGLLRPSVAPDGEAIAFTALGDLWIRREGPEPEALTRDPWLDVDPAWSPDGRTIAFLSDRGGDGTMRLYVYDIEEKAVRRLTGNTEDLRMPAWSPDGSRLAVFMRNSLDWHATDLYLVDAASGEMTLAHSGLFLPSAPSWSPDGKTIVTMVVTPGTGRFREGFNEFLFLSVETGATRRVSPSPGQNLGSRAKHGPVWSPDGRYLAFVKESVLWLQPVSFDGVFRGPARAITSKVADAPAWAADSKSVTFVSLGRLKRVSIDDGHVRELPLSLDWRRAIARGERLVHAGRLFDGVGEQYRENIDILIRDNRVVSVTPHENHPEAIDVVDASEHTVVPGLFQMHVHHFVTDGEWDGRNWLAYGITSVREPGADPYEALERRESWDAARRLGPRLFYAGIVEGNRAYYWMNIPVTSEAQLELELQRVRALDYDFIKTYEWLDHPIQRRITEFAHDLGITVASHEIYPAAKYGVDVVEHLGTSDRMETSDRVSMRRTVYADVVEIMVHSGMAIVPTAAGRAPGTGYTQQMSSTAGVFDLPQFRAIPARFQQSARQLWQWQQKAFADGEDVVANEQSSILRLSEAGVPVTTGTDGGTDSHGYSLILEIKHFAESGLGAAGALKAATIASARASGVGGDLGSIEPGKLADLVIVDGDPLADITDLFNVESVMRDGRLFSIEQLLTPPQSPEAKR